VITNNWYARTAPGTLAGANEDFDEVLVLEKENESLSLPLRRH
jgi:hypothetical protein